MNWDTYLMGVARAVSMKSKDQSTKVGAVIADPDTHRILATGFNGFPPGVNDTAARWQRPLKYKYVVHAEANAILTAARFGVPIAGADLYVTLPPCSDCAKLLAAAGIRRVFYWGNLEGPSGTWRDNDDVAKSIFQEARILLVRLELV